MSPVIHIAPFGAYYLDSVGSDKCILTVGDSWTYGDGPVSGQDACGRWKAPEIHWEETGKVNYQFHLRKLISDYDILNIGIRGASVPAAVENLIAVVDVLKRYSKVIVLFGVTYPSRDLINLSSYNHPVDFQPGWVEQFIESYKLNSEDADLVRRYSMGAAGPSSDFYRYYHNLYTILAICKSNNYEPILYHIFKASAPSSVTETTEGALGHYRKLVPDEVISKIDGMSMHEYLLKLGENSNGDMFKYILPCYHPNTEGYEIMATKLYELLADRL